MLFTTEQKFSTLKIYGAADKRDQIGPSLRWATPANRKSSAPSGYSAQVSSSSQTAEALRKQQEAFDRAAELNQMLSNLERVDDEGRRSSLLDTLCSTEDVLNLPEHPSPPSIRSGELRVDLLRHQARGLLVFEIEWCSVYSHVHRSRHYSGRLSTKVRNSQQKKRTSQSSSGNIERRAPRYVQILNLIEPFNSFSCRFITTIVRIHHGWPSAGG